MRPLPRVHAITNGGVLGLEDLGVRAAAIASAGPSVALHVRDHAATGARLTGFATRLLTLARPPEAALIVNGHPEIAQAIGAHGVELSRQDLAPEDARAIFPSGWIGASVHSAAEAEMAARSGADFLLVGTIFPSATEPGKSAQGTGLIRSCAAFELPVIAIGGITPERIAEARESGAYGVAAISALWSARDPAAATMAFLDAWTGGDDGT